MPHVDTPQSCCLFGLARCDITPPIGIYHRMWGAATHDRATGVHRPLTATALVFRPRREASALETEQVVVAVDLCLLWAREMATLIDVVCRQTGVAAKDLVIVFSHTHSAGLMGLERVSLPGGELIPPFLEKLAAGIVKLVDIARREVQPATIVYGTGRCSLAGQRDFWDEASGQFVCGYNPEGQADDTVLVGRVTNEAGQSLATLVNYACHLTTLAWQNTLISPDFPGALREIVEQATDCPCIFLQGASGDLGPREGFVGDVRVADRNGRQLGHAALAVLESLPPPSTRFQYRGPVISGATLGTWEHVAVDTEQQQQHQRWRRRYWTVSLAYRAELPTLDKVRAQQAHWLGSEQEARQAGDLAKARDCRAMVERMDRQMARLTVLPPGKTFPMPVTLWQMGAAVWLAVEGEHYQLLQRALRHRFAGVPIVVMTLANGSRPAYLPTKDAYGKGIYQESIAVLAKGCLEELIEAIEYELMGWMLHT